MPNIWTHLIFGRELLTQMGKSDLIASEAARSVFQLGCQGPDFLFYHNFLPWQKDRRLSELGSRIHHEQCGPFLVEMVQQMRGRAQTDLSVLYVAGFLTHHILDRNMHPYINYKSGFKKWNHQRLEVIIDTLAARKLLAIETWKTPVWRQIESGVDFPDGVVKMFETLTAKFFPEAAAQIQTREWTEAYRQMIQAQKIFHDPTGCKRLLTFGQIEPMVYKKTLAPLDYLNEAKQEWNDPTSFAETYTYSFWDLWQQALQDGEKVLAAAFQYWTGETVDPQTASRLIKAIGNRSYDTGKDCGSPLQTQFVNPILD